MIGKKILLVDENKELVYGMSVWLKSKGFQVLSATDATSANTMANTEKPDLIILDISLPGVDDDQTTARFKALMHPPHHIPTIVITSGDASGHREKVLQAGAEAFFQKPFDGCQLLAAMEKALMDEPPGSTEKKLEGLIQKRILIVDDNQDLLHALQVRKIPRVQSSLRLGRLPGHPHCPEDQARPGHPRRRSARRR